MIRTNPEFALIIALAFLMLICYVRHLRQCKKEVTKARSNIEKYQRNQQALAAERANKSRTVAGASQPHARTSGSSSHSGAAQHSSNHHAPQTIFFDDCNHKRSGCGSDSGSSDSSSSDCSSATYD